MPYKSYEGRRVAFLHHQLALGGSERVSYDAACYLRGLGISCHFFAAHCDRERWQQAGASEFPVHIIPELGKNTCFTSPAVEVLIQYVKELSIEVLFVAVPDRTLPYKVKLETDCMLVYWLHSIPYFEAHTKIESYRTQGERSWYNRLMWHFVHKPRLLWGNRLLSQWQEAYQHKLWTYDAMLVLCPGYREQLIAELQLSKEDAECIFVKTNVLSPQPEPQLRKDKQIIYMGRLSRSDKRIDRLLRVWALVQHRLPEWELLIYGSGDKEERYLRRLAGELSLVRCHFKGFVTSPQEAYKTASILCMTSSYEGYPLALAEAQCAGVVPVAFDVSEGIRCIMGEADKASLIQPFDLDAYAGELIRLCTDPEYYKARQAYAIERSVALSNSEQSAQEWASILRHLF